MPSGSMRFLRFLRLPWFVSLVNWKQVSLVNPLVCSRFFFHGFGKYPNDAIQIFVTDWDLFDGFKVACYDTSNRKRHLELTGLSKFW